jgi:2-oxoglutarate dehydrogenase E2 component (dihydrolipoamide succinyltransferase)
MSIEVRVPTLGESVTEATVATWFKKPGEAVAADEMLCELETDKVTVEVPAPVAGTLGEIVAAEGRNRGRGCIARHVERRGGRRARRRPKPMRPKRPRQPSESGGESVDVMVPTLGESVTEATVATWFKKPGDEVAQDEMLCELETDKVSVEVPAPASGTLSRILAEEGTTVEAGGKLAVIGGSVAAASPAPPPRRRRPHQADASATGGKDVANAPSAEKLMAEKGLDAASMFRAPAATGGS